MIKIALAAIFVSLSWSPVRAYEEPTEISTQPIGSPFFRHLAADYHLDLKELVKLEKRGFGRAETITLVLISSGTDKTFKDLAKRRLKEKISLEALANERGIDYNKLYLDVRKIKEQIEAKGDQNLPPPVFETPSPTPTPVPKEKKKKREKDDEKT